MKKWILMNQLVFLKQFSSLQEGLAKEFHDYQVANPTLGIVKTGYEAIEKLNLGDIKDYSKNQWKKAVKIKIQSIQKEELIEEMKRYKKIDYRTYESQEFKLREFFSKLNLRDIRVKVQSELFMIPSIRKNFKNNRRYKEENFSCPDCTSIGILNISDSQEHVLTSSCQANSDLKIGRDFSKDKDLCDFFHDLIERRIERYGC